MKKIFFISLLSVFLFTGCSLGTTKTMNCSYESDSDNLYTKMNYDIDYQDKDVKKVRITYDYKEKNMEHKDGIGTGTDGTTSDTERDKDGIIDGVVGKTLDDIVGGVSDTILDITGLKERHNIVRNQYGSITGFSVQNTTDTDDNYKVTYVIDFDSISDTDLTNFNLSRDIDTLRESYISQGYTCNK